MLDVRNHLKTGSAPANPKISKNVSRLLQDVTGELSKLPGIGRRTALRLAIHLLRMEPDSVSDMTRSIDRFRRDIKYCKLCNNLSDEEICPISRSIFRSEGAMPCIGEITPPNT